MTSNATYVPFEDLPLLLTVMQFAEAVGISRTLAYELVKLWDDTDGRKGVRSVRIGERCRRIPRSEVERLYYGGEFER